MCTAIAYRPKGFFFGRTLDTEVPYPCEITVTPRAFPLPFRALPTLQHHHAIIGMAYVADGYPLYFDAMNEKGLAMAGLNFTRSTVYREARAGCDNLAQFELIPYLLGRCESVVEAKGLLSRTVLTNEAFSAQLPPSKLHWLLADAHESITVEAVAEGLCVYSNAADTLTNEPPFPTQLHHLSSYMGLSPRAPENNFAPKLELHHYSRGMGAIGLPGDLSSPSRFVRAAFTLRHSACDGTEEGCVNQFFHILGAVDQVRGCCDVNGRHEITRYTSCCSADALSYYCSTYESRQITAVDMRRCALDGNTLACYPLVQREQIARLN